MILKEIGKVEGMFKEKKDPFVMRKEQSRIVLYEEFTEGLYRLSESAYIQVVFGFHLSGGYSLKGPVYSGEVKGVFASRSPNRPSPLGVTTVKLVNIDSNILTVIGLDAVDGSPVYDLKPYASVFDEPPDNPADNPADNPGDFPGEEFRDKSYKKEWAYSEPRSEMLRFIRSNNLEAILLNAGTYHGHFCPGLSSGVYASVVGMNKLYVSWPSDGMEKIIAVTETNNCFSDGVQAVTGCTFGNNALIYYDIGKTALTLVKRGDKTGIRISMKPDFSAILEETYPEYSGLFHKVVKQRAGTEEDMAAFKIKGREASFGLLSLPFDRLFDVNEVQVEIPPYAPIFNSVICDKCKEQCMESRAVKKDGLLLCRHCSRDGFFCLTGEGISAR